MKKKYLILLLAAVCLMPGCGSLGRISDSAGDTLDNTKRATAIVATRVEQADAQIKELTEKFSTIKEDLTSKVDSVTESVGEVTDKVTEIKDDVIERVDKVKEKIGEDVDELKAEMAEERSRLEKVYGVMDKDGDGRVSLSEAVDKVKANPDAWWKLDFWKMILYGLLGIGGAAGAKKGGDVFGKRVLKKHGGEHAEEIYQAGRQKRIEKENGGPSG